MTTLDDVLAHLRERLDAVCVQPGGEDDPTGHALRCGAAFEIDRIAKHIESNRNDLPVATWHKRPTKPGRWEKWLCGDSFSWVNRGIWTYFQSDLDELFISDGTRVLFFGPLPDSVPHSLDGDESMLNVYETIADIATEETRKLKEKRP